MNTPDIGLAKLNEERKLRGLPPMDSDFNIVRPVLVSREFAEDTGDRLYACVGLGQTYMVSAGSNSLAQYRAAARYKRETRSYYPAIFYADCFSTEVQSLRRRKFRRRGDGKRLSPQPRKPWERKICPLCGNSTAPLVQHHWVKDSVVYEVEICNSCNVNLGRLFGESYPSWEEQVGTLRQFFDRGNESCRRSGNTPIYPDYPKCRISELKCEVEALRNLVEYEVSILEETYRIDTLGSSEARRKGARLYKESHDSGYSLETLKSVCSVRRVSPRKPGRKPGRKLVEVAS